MKQFFLIFFAIVILNGCATSNQNSAINQNNPEAVWNRMKACLAAGDIPGAVSCFSIESKDDYQKQFASISKTDLNLFLKKLGPIKKASIEDDKAQYYFKSEIRGAIITFPIEFDRENGEWKIIEF